MIPRFAKLLYIRYKFSGYRPQPVTSQSLDQWLKQYSREDQDLLIELLLHVRFVGEDETRNLLLARNSSLLAKLKKDGVDLDKIVYISFDDAGSSSSVMLNMLKESALLERTQCKFVDSNNTLGIVEITRSLKEGGAIIYVDDFIGTGSQFCRARDFALDYYQGVFSEFLLTACICDEAIYKLGERGISGYYGFVHTAIDRPLHDFSSLMAPEKKERLLELGREINSKWSLGYNNMGSMVIFYRNTPNGTPLLLRGNVGQDIKVGIVPRTTDLPILQ